jgi:hypothetical protein
MIRFFLFLLVVLAFSGGTCVKAGTWLRMIRYDREAKDSVPGSMYHLEDLNAGSFRLPRSEIVNMTYFHSRVVDSIEESSETIAKITGKVVDNVVSVVLTGLMRRAIGYKYNKGLAKITNGGSGSNIVEYLSRYFTPAQMLALPPLAWKTAVGFLGKDKIEEAIQVAVSSAAEGFFDMESLSHQYVVLVTKDGKSHSIEKFDDFLDVRTSRDFDAVSNYRHGATGQYLRVNPRFANVKSWKSPAKKLYLSDLVPFLQNETQREYSMLLDNCQHFADRLWSLLMTPHEFYHAEN